MDTPPLATVATGQLHAAALHAALLTPGCTGAVIQANNQANYESIASSLTYSQSSEWSFIFDILSHYDLTDVEAALAPLPQLIYAPTDANGKGLNEADTNDTFAFAKQVYASVGATQHLQIVPSTARPDPDQRNKAVVSFLRGLPINTPTIVATSPRDLTASSTNLPSSVLRLVGNLTRSIMVPKYCNASSPKVHWDVGHAAIWAYCAALQTYLWTLEGQKDETMLAKGDAFDFGCSVI